MINLPFFKKKEKIEYFLALLLRDEKVSAVIFEESSGKVKVIGKHQEYFQKSIEDAAEDEWLDILDKAISTAENSLPSDIETHKTIFGIKENWTDGSKIKKEYLLKLKKVSDALSLSPIGFMVIQEAIAHLMQKEEGVPVSAIFVEVDKKNIAVSLLKMGKIIDTKRLEIEKTIPYTTDQVLHYFAGHEILPSRIVLYDGGENLENLSQEFISHPWSKSLPFLHVPQVSILSSGFDAKAVLFGAATQMGFEMIDKDETAIIKEKNEHTSKIQELNTPEEANESTIQEETSEVNKEEITEEIIPKNNFGFILNKDILKKEIKEEEKTLKQHEHPPEEIKAEEEFTNKEYAIEIDKTPRNSSKNIIGNATKLAFVLTPFKKILSLGISVIFSFKKIFPFIFLKGGTKFILAATALLIFIIAISIGYFFGLKSTITIELKPKIIEKNQPVSFIVDKNSDFSNKIIQGQYVEVSKNGTLSAPATGKKEIGEKAKGNVTIYSRLTSEKTLTAGTVIASSNDLNFTLDSDVKLASSSADASSDPTTAKVGVTAKSIGKEYNLPSNTKFTFGDLPATTIVAKNETAFGGGSKKEINVVSKDDMDKLAAKLPKDLEDDAKNELNKNAGNDKEIIPLFVNTEVKKEFNKKAGDEAETLTIKGTVTYQAISYKKGELLEFSKSLISNDAKNLYISSNGVKYELVDLKQKSEKEVTGTFKVKAFLYPNIDKEKILKNITGKSISDAESIVSKMDNVDSVDIKLHPALPLLPKIMPRRSQNISIKIMNNE